ncbi:DUF4259 domain-containing protein [Catellatospora vulcania]|uniref:DUF4259 domain-containing protein n=1 Tax=Catellatospora vulcania TaxID=1460450 RepID=UPI0018AF95B5
MAYGIDPLENDGALDLCHELREASRGGARRVLEEALAVAIEAGEDEYLEKDCGEAAVAAAAIISALGRNELAVLERRRLESVEFGLVDDLAAPALVALTRVGGTESELLDLWEAEGREQEFRTCLQDISNSLRSLQS